MPIQLLLTLVAVFVSVGLVSWTLASLALARAAPERRRLNELTGSEGPQQPSLSKTPLSEASSRIAALNKMIVPVSPNDLPGLQRRLGKAGYQGTKPVVVFLTAQVVCCLVFAGLALWFLPGDTRSWLLALLATAIGYFVPTLVLDYKTSQRKKMIANGLPDALDLLVVCLEAGSSLDQAIVKASDELRIAYPALADELRTLTLETRAGKPRLEAFKNLAARTGVDEVRTLVTMLVQTDRFGTSLGQALRTQAATARTMRRQRAEERAQKIGVKLVFPLVFMLFPAFYVVILGPAVIQFMRVFFGQMKAGS